MYSSSEFGALGQSYWALSPDPHLLEYLSLDRVGSCLTAICIVCRDEQWNHMAFKCIPDIAIKLTSYGKEFSQIKKFKVDLSSDKLSLIIQNLFINTKDLDKLHPAYEVTLVISDFENSHKLHIPCEVLPGALQHATLCPLNLQNDLVPGFLRTSN
ncbi:hypothetical protein Droror1_Dr00013091 [Drosera rotundifolia]